MPTFIRFGVLMLVAALGCFPFVPEEPVDAMLRAVPAQQAKLGSSVVWTEEQDDVVGMKGPLRIAIEGRLRWLGLM